MTHACTVEACLRVPRVMLSSVPLLEPVTHVLMVFTEWQPGLSHVVCILTT